MLTSTIPGPERTDILVMYRKHGTPGKPRPTRGTDDQYQADLLTVPSGPEGISPIYLRWSWNHIHSGVSRCEGGGERSVVPAPLHLMT